MRFDLSRLPQLAVSAKLLCLLMVVICGAVPPMVRSVQLYNEGKYVRVDTAVHMADGNKDDKLTNLTFTSVDLSGAITISGHSANRYICFNKRWKIVASRKRKGRWCMFKETIDANGFTLFISAKNDTFYLGFNNRGKPLKGEHAMYATYKNTAKVRRFQFLKRDSSGFVSDQIDKHNKKKNNQPNAPHVNLNELRHQKQR